MKPVKPLVIAHRGFTQNHLENTLSAIEAALDLGVDGIEVDLRMTRDGQILIFHDETLERLAGLATDVERVDYATLQGVRLQGGEKIPTLEDLLDLVQGRCLLNLEVKTVRTLPTHERNLTQVLRRYQCQDNILLSSFNPLAMIRLRWIAPEIRRGFLYQKKSPLASLAMSLMKLYSYHGQLENLRPEIVPHCHRLGKKFFVWTVNEIADMQAMIRLGVEGIITDHPDLMKKTLKLFFPLC